MVDLVFTLQSDLVQDFEVAILETQDGSIKTEFLLEEPLNITSETYTSGQTRPFRSGSLLQYPNIVALLS